MFYVKTASISAAFGEWFRDQNKQIFAHSHEDAASCRRHETYNNLGFWCRSSRSEVFLVKRVLKICSKFTGEHPCRSGISIKLLCNFIEITLWHGCSPVNLLNIFRTRFSKNTSGGLLLLVAFRTSETQQLWTLN